MDNKSEQIPDSVHGFLWKAARWEVFLGIILITSLLTSATQRHPYDFFTFFILLFLFEVASVLMGLSIPALFRFFYKKQGGIILSGLLACLGWFVSVFFLTVFCDFAGYTIIGGGIFVRVMTMVFGYKIVRREYKTKITASVPYRSVENTFEQIITSHSTQKELPTKQQEARAIHPIQRGENTISKRDIQFVNMPRKKGGSGNFVGWIALAICIILVASLWILFQQQKEMKNSLRHIKGEIESISFTKEEILSIVRQENQKQKSHIDDLIKQVNEKLQNDINDLQDSLAGVKNSQDEIETFFKEKMEIAMDEINGIKSDSAVKQMKDNGIPLLDKPDFNSPRIRALAKKSKQWRAKNNKTAEKRFIEISAFLLRHHTEDKTIADTFSQNIVLLKELDASNGMPDSFMKMRIAYYFMKEIYGPDAAKEPGVYFLSRNKPKPKLKSDTYYSAFVAVYDDLASDTEKIYLKSQEEQKLDQIQ